MSQLQLLQLTKIDARSHTAWGIATSQVEDSAGETMHYERSKPHFEKWTQQFAKASGGKSFGNVRGMHKQLAAGKVIHFEMRDDKKQIYIGAEIVDQAEWEKCEKGVYTGFSIGGSYGDRWEESGTVYYEAIPSEISLVDNPCNKEAVFEFVKADGMTEQKQFVTEATDMKKVFPPAKPEAKPAAPAVDEKIPPAAPAAAEKTQPAAPAAEEQKTGAPAPGENPGNPGATDRGKAENAKAPDQGEQEQAAPESEALAMIDAALEAGEITPELAEKLKAVIAKEEASEPGSADPTAGTSGMAAGVDKEATRALILELLEELDLVERVDNGAGKIEVTKVEPPSTLEKVEANYGARLQKVAETASVELDLATNTLNERISTDVGKLAKDIATIYDLMEKRLAQIEGMGPVIRDVGNLNATSMAKAQELDQLHNMLATTKDAKDRQDLQLRIAQLEINSIQR